MRLIMFRCDSCGKLHEGSQRPFAERDYVGWGKDLHFCKGCAKGISIYDLTAPQIQLEPVQLMLPFDE